MADLARSPLAPLLHRIYPLSHILGYRPKGYRPPQHRGKLWSKPIILRLEKSLRMLIGTWTCITLIALTARTAPFRDRQVPLVVGSFGAESVVLFSNPQNPFAQPRNAILGNTLSAIIGVGVTKLFALNHSYKTGDIFGINWAAAATATATATFTCEFLGFPHPPGGATALLASVLPQVFAVGWFYPGVILVDTLIMLTVALLINNVINLGESGWPNFFVSPSLFANREYGTGRIVDGPDAPLVAAEESDTQGLPHPSLRLGR